MATDLKETITTRDHRAEQALARSTAWCIIEGSLAAEAATRWANPSFTVAQVTARLD